MYEKYGHYRYHELLYRLFERLCGVPEKMISTIDFLLDFLHEDNTSMLFYFPVNVISCDAPLRCGFDSNLKTRGSCELLTEYCWFTPRNNLFFQLWKLTAIYNQIMLKNSPHLTFT